MTDVDKILDSDPVAQLSFSKIQLDLYQNCLILPLLSQLHRSSVITFVVDTHALTKSVCVPIISPFFLCGNACDSQIKKRHNSCTHAHSRISPHLVLWLPPSFLSLSFTNHQINSNTESIDN